MLKIEQFVEQNFGIKLSKYQLEMIAMIAANPDIEVLITPIGKRAGKTTAVKAALAYLQDGLKAADTEKVDRFEVIDHRECIWCRGRKTANYSQKDGSYKELPCDKCDGSGTRGGRVFGAFTHAEVKPFKVEVSYQDDGRTLKVFLADMEVKSE